jgi:hypothetical protein
MSPPLILKRAPIGWNQDDFDVLENARSSAVSFSLMPVGPQGRPWMWASNNGDLRRAAHGDEHDSRGRDGGLCEIVAAGRSSPVSGRRRCKNHCP